MLLADAERKEMLQYSKVITFSLDEARRNIKARDRRLHDQLTEMFCEDLYFRRTWTEKEMRRFILDSRRVLSVEGVEGCGKSTITRRVLASLRKEYPSLILDFNLLGNDPKFKEARDYGLFNKALWDILRRELLARFFAERDDRMEALYDLALFSDEPVTAREFVDERLTLASLLGRNVLGADNKEQREWYNGHKTAERVRILREDVRAKITCSHLILVLRDAMPFDERFIVVLDNVDRLERRFQPYCYDFALLFNDEMQEFAKIVINIRPENAHLPEEVAGQHSEHVDTLRLVDLGDRYYENTYLDSEGFHSILASRMEAYLKIFGTTSLGTKLSFLTKSLKDQYAEVILIDLANQSIRTALEYHCRFLSYLLETCPYSQLEQSARTGRLASLLVSCLLGWIAECGEVMSDQSLNIAKLVYNGERSGYHTRGCDLSYLILVCLSKQTVNPRGEEIYRISLQSLAGRLAMLGYSEDEVQNEVYHLYFNKNKEFGHIISISNDEVIHEKESITGKTQISLNFRGKRLIEAVSIKFFFINRLLNKTNARDISKYEGPLGYYDYSNYIEHAKDNLHLLAHAAVLHSIELVRIAEKMASDDWLLRYKREFAIDAQLQLYRILWSNMRFLQNSKQHFETADQKLVSNCADTMNILSNVYDRFVKSITLGITYVYDYDKIVTECLKGGAPPTEERFLTDQYKMAARRLIDAGITKK